MAIGTKLTIDEFLDSSLIEEKPYRELIHGEPVPKMAPTRRHQRLEHVLVHLFNLDEATAGGEGLTELHVRFDDPVDGRVLVPDFISYQHPPDEIDEVLQGPPNFVAEIRSPCQSLTTLRKKAGYYLAHGVETVWLLDPRAETAEIRDAAGVTELLERSDILRFRAFTIPVGELYDSWDRYFGQGR